MSKGSKKTTNLYLFMKPCHPACVVCSHLNHNEKNGGVSLCFMCFLYFAVNSFPPLCFPHIWLMILLVRFYYLAHADAHVFFFFTGLYRYGCWTQLLYIIITLIVNGMSISFCWGYLMLIKKLCVQAHFAERKFKTWIFYETCLVWLDDCDQVLRAAAPNSVIPSWNFWRPVLKMDGILIPR